MTRSYSIKFVVKLLIFFFFTACYFHGCFNIVIVTGKKYGGESRLVHRTVRLELHAQRVRLRSDHGRRFLAAVHAVFPQFVRSDFAVHLHSVVFAFGLKNHISTVSTTSDGLPRTFTVRRTVVVYTIFFPAHRNTTRFRSPGATENKRDGKQ